MMQTIDRLSNKYGSLVPLESVCHEIGKSVHTARNEIAANKFPIILIQRGRRYFAHIKRLADYIDNLDAAAQELHRNAA